MRQQSQEVLNQSSASLQTGTPIIKYTGPENLHQLLHCCNTDQGGKNRNEGGKLVAQHRSQPVASSFETLH